MVMLAFLAATAIGEAQAAPVGPHAIERISVSATSTGASVLIETSGPVAFVTTSAPDTLTVLVELWQTTAPKGVGSALRDPSGTIARCAVETFRDLDGSSRARVQLTLARPARHELRTAGRQTFLQFERLPERPDRTGIQRPVRQASVPVEIAAVLVPAPPVDATGAATELSGLEISSMPEGPTITLMGNGRLVPSSVSLATEPVRLILDFPKLAPSIPKVTPGDLNTVQRVRAAIFTRSPLVTRVVIDLARSMPYRVVQSDETHELRVVFPLAPPPLAQANAKAESAPGLSTRPVPTGVKILPSSDRRLLTAEIAPAPSTALRAAGSSSFALGIRPTAPTGQIFRLFLKDGSAVPSYGEYARVGEQVVFSFPMSSEDVEQALHVVSLPAGVIDWDRTYRYTESARATSYITTRGEIEFQALATRVVRTLNDIPSMQDPNERLSGVEAVRKELKAWPREHFGYRRADIEQISELLDGVVSELRVAAGVSAFDLTFESAAADAELLPLLPAPSRKESLESALKIARLMDVPAERMSLMASIAAVLRRPDPSLPHSWATETYKLVTRALAAERHVEGAYVQMSRTVLRKADLSAHHAEVREIEVLLLEIGERDDRLGNRRPDTVIALRSAVQAKLEAARQLQLARDQWALRSASYQSYRRAAKRGLGEFERSESKLSAIKQFTGPPAPVLTEFGARWGETRRMLGAIEPPQELRSAHTLLIKAAELAQNAFGARFQAVASNNVQRAADASAAAAGAMMLFSQAQNELRAAMLFPQLK